MRFFFTRRLTYWDLTASIFFLAACEDGAWVTAVGLFLGWALIGHWGEARVKELADG